MKKRAQGLMVGLVLGLMTAGGISLASNVTLPFTFAAGTPAKASEVNSNFAAVKTAVDDTQTQVSALAGRVTTLEGGGGGGAPRVVDANGKTVGPYFLFPSTYPSPAYLAADKSLWLLNLSTGELDANSIDDRLAYTSANCGGAAYYQVGSSSSRPPVKGAVVKLGSTSVFRVLRGPTVSLKVLSYREPSTSTTCTAGEPYYAHDPYILVSDAPAITKPAVTWTAPLAIEL